jgi:uncharacterized membrane protein YeaQ/YmgE (transglycosylase-associated protein family)
MSTAPWFAWIVIGVAASLAGMVWPFRRGALGIAANIASGVVGAIAGGLVSYWLLPWSRQGNTSARLFFAALGALTCLVALHVAYRRRVAFPRAPAP